MKNRKIKLAAISLVLALLLGINAPMAHAATNAQQPTITTQPGNANVNVNESVTLSVAAAVTDSGTLSYQWYINTDDNNTDGSPINGATLSSFTPATRLEGTLYYYVVVTNTNKDATGATTATVTSNAVRVTVRAPALTNAQTPAFTTQPRDASVLLNDRLNLTVEALINDGGTLSYQWFRNTTDRNSGGTAISGATGRTYTPPTEREGTTFYYVVAANTNNNVSGSKTAAIASGTAMVTVSIPVNAQTPNITYQPEGATVTLGGSITLAVNAQIRDGGTLSYQWFRNTAGRNSEGTAISGATRATFSPETDTVGVVYYYVEVTNTNNNVSGVGIVKTASSAVPVTVSTTPGVPYSFTATPGADYVTLSWEYPEDDGYGEIVLYQVSIDLVNFWFETDEEFEHTFTDLVSETEYTFKIRAVNEAGYGEEATLTVTTLEPEPVYLTGISLDEEKLDILIGESIELTATLSPEDADDQTVTWESSNTDVATVDENGIVKALAKGTAIITVTTNDGGYTARCIVTVEYYPMSDNLLLWIGLGTLAPLGTGTGVYLWRRKRR